MSLGKKSANTVLHGLLDHALLGGRVGGQGGQLLGGVDAEERE